MPVDCSPQPIAPCSKRTSNDELAEPARFLRLCNAEASIYPFLFLGLTFVLAGGGASAATIIFGVFAVARLLHTVAYLKALQPWRSVFFLAGVLCIVALMVGIVWQIVRAG